MRRVLAVASAALVSVLGLGVSTASAAQMPVFAGLHASVTEAAACAPALAAGQAVLNSTSSGTGAGGSYSAVTVSEVPNACSGLALEVFVHDAAGGVIASGSTTASASSAVPVGAYSATAVDTVVARIGGWIFPTTWTAPAPPTAPLTANCVVVSQVADVSGACTVTVTAVGGIQTSAQGAYQEVQVSVSHSVPQPRYWTADFNFAEVPGLLVGPTRLGADWGNASAPQGCGEFPVVSLRGTDYQFAVSWYVGEYPTWRTDICG